MALPARLISDHWNSTPSNQEVGELMTSSSEDKLKEICSDSDRSHADHFDEGADASEEEDVATFTKLKDEINDGRLEEAMPCTQSFQDTEGLEEHIMLNDRMYGNSRASAFSGYKAPGAQLRIMASNGCHSVQMGEENSYTDPSMSSTPFWYRGDVPSQCSRGCCAFPRVGLSLSPRGTLLGPEYVEYGEDSFPQARNGLARWNSNTDNRFPNGSMSMASSPAVSDTLVSMLKHKNSGREDNTLSSIIREIVAREISQHTAAAIQALEQQH